MSGRARSRGMVLVTGLFLLTLLGVFLLGFGRSTSVALAHAEGARAADRAFQAADDAVAEAIRATRFDRAAAAPRVIRPRPGVSVSITQRYLGETVPLPHPAWDAVRDAPLRAHHFRVTAEARAGPAFVIVERDVAIIAPAGIARSAALSTAPTAATAPFGGPVIPGPWRAR